MQRLQHGCFHCLSHGTGQRGEGVCHSCCVQEQGQGCIEYTHIWLLVGTQVRVLAVPQCTKGQVHSRCTSGVGLGPCSNNQGRGELKHR